MHCEIEYDTQEGDFEEGDMTERHITNTVVLRMDAKARRAEAEAPTGASKSEL